MTGSDDREETAEAFSSCMTSVGLHIALCVLVTTAVAASGSSPVRVADDPEGEALVAAARRTIAEYHAAHSDAKKVLRIVYFHPNDRDPLPNYADRLERVMSDISDFYRDGLRRFGIENNGLPLERRDGRVVLHIVRGTRPASRYRHDDEGGPKEEMRSALKGTFDLDREHVLVIYGLCRRKPDGRYVFDAPYYGGGSQRAGLCHAADCELLDPLLLHETERKIVYTEHYYPRMEQTIARFNSWYLGGIAHELGHGLGLSHDAGGSAEQSFGTSLMGGGNHTYRQETWGGGQPTFLSRVTALQLASHPLFTGSDRGRWEGVGIGFESLAFSIAGGVLHVRGKAVGDIPPYAVIAYVWPARDKTDHGARTFVTGLKGGEFDLPLDDLNRDNYNFILASLHANGATSRWELKLRFDRPGAPDIATTTEAWSKALVERAERAMKEQWPRARTFVSDEVIAHAPSATAQRKLRALRAALDR